MIRRDGDIVWLEGVCAVEDAEPLLQHAQEGCRTADWSGCALLHTACLQVILAAPLTLRGVPQNALLTAFVRPLLPAPAVGEPADIVEKEI